MSQKPTRAHLSLAPTVTRLVALGDPHGDLAGVEAVFAAEDGPGVAWFCVGDVVGSADGPTSSRLVVWMRDRGVHTVEGNHEDWALPTGHLAVLDDRHADPELTPQARNWIAGLPREMEISHPGHPGLRVAMAHAHRDPRWRNVEAFDVKRLVDHMGGPRVLLVGHTHRARILRLPEHSARATSQVLDFRTTPEITAPIPLDGTLTLDAGSIAAPWLGNRVYVPRAERRAYGTYAVLDLATGTAHVRAIRKPA
jgi:predicted phosphodiesterase